MRFWISRNSTVSLRDQLTAQIMLGVISEDLKPGERLPSIREFAQRHSIHSNTVSAAYRELAERGWLKISRGSGVSVSRPPWEPESENLLPLDRFTSKLFLTARSLGISAPEVRAHLRQLLHQPLNRLVILEPEVELGEILATEIRLGTGINTVIAAKQVPIRKTAIAMLASRTQKITVDLSASAPRFLLRVRSLTASFRGQERPSRNQLLVVASHSPEILRWSRTLLLAAGIDADAMNICDARETGWKRSLQPGTIVIADIVTARQIPDTCQLRLLQVIAESSIDELRYYFTDMRTPSRV